ncbi:hypothetical protein GDO86_004968 [Hymenochirus boettgeri]|uniref:Uncharacterized protein n=1 Tax=Hymenochirus boettgeri TaxID=247094 RepID=A0A8T2J2T5_9PIPI|nr:hypothetical protein GDO86_004968 [Hymenochirus boettgeri]
MSDLSTVEACTKHYLPGVNTLKQLLLYYWASLGYYSRLDCGKYRAEPYSLCTGSRHQQAQATAWNEWCLNAQSPHSLIHCDCNHYPYCTVWLMRE